jgi:hypothetical protein
MESSTKTRLPLHSNGIIYPSPSLHNTPNWYNPSLLFTCTNGEKVKMALNVSSFGDSCQRGEDIKPKAKGPHHQFQKIQNTALIDIFHWYLCHGNISIDILILRKQHLKWYCFKLQLISCNDNFFN